MLSDQLTILQDRLMQESGAQSHPTPAVSFGLLERALDAVGYFVASDVAAREGTMPPAPPSSNLEDATRVVVSPDFGSPLAVHLESPQPAESAPAIESSEVAVAAVTSTQAALFPRPRNLQPAADVDVNVDNARALPAAVPYRSRRRRTQVTREGFVASDLRGLSFGESVVAT